MKSDLDLGGIALGFASVSLVAIGGVGAIVPEINRVVVDVHGWMDDPTFAKLFAVGQIAPGPNVIVIGLIGWQIAGIAGLVAAMLGMCLPSCLLAYGATRLRSRLADAPWMRAVRTGLVPLAVGLVLASGVVLAGAAAQGAVQAAVCIALTAAATLFVWRTAGNPLWTIAAGAVVGLAAGLATGS
jgi:chromate transporter